MTLSTTDYDMFIFREDNRLKIEKSHVQRLVKSISARNLLELRPINVNEKMEIIDGQNRLLAAKELGVPIYYKIEKSLEAQDIILLNNAAVWKPQDYLNFYCSHEYPEYLNLKKFMDENGLSLRVAMNICCGDARNVKTKFKEGGLKFDLQNIKEFTDICWETIEYIKRMNGTSQYLSSSRFWKALLKIVRHESFDSKHWFVNVQKMVHHFTIKARAEDYLHMMQHVYNWRATTKIKFSQYD